MRRPIRDIYGFVRFADEIVDSFGGYDQEILLEEFTKDTFIAIERKISLNPILNSFQQVVNEFNIDHELIHCFLRSMKMDLLPYNNDQESYEDYILGSAEVVGLMCLKVFCNGSEEQFQELKPSAMKLGAAFQKVNFLRDAKDDFEVLGRTYFPEVNMNNFSAIDKKAIERDIDKDFQEALVGIKQLPTSSRKGVYLAYIYYLQLYKKIRRMPANKVLEQRTRIPNLQKLSLMFYSLVRHELNIL
jgi:phytoene/squalene synthetase